MEPTANQPAMLVMPTVLHVLADGGPSTPLPAELQYDVTDPYAVRLALGTPENANTWLFARELLARGLEEPTGDGDIHVWPGVTDEGQVLLMELAAENDVAVLAVRLSDVCAFLARSYGLVPAGTEASRCDIESFIASILSGVQNSTSDE